MNKKSIAFLSLIIAFSATAQAGLKSFTMNSRANCVNNESISWRAGFSYKLKTYSNHYGPRGQAHSIITGLENTWRSAAVHWNEAYAGNGWMVIGEHWGDMNDGMGYRHLKETVVNNCSIYDGWWD
jgi:hypothetical protein